MTNFPCRDLFARIIPSAMSVCAALVIVIFAAHTGSERAAWAETPKLAAAGPSDSAPRNLLSLNLPENGEALREDAARLFERVYERQDQAAESAGVETYEEIYVDLPRLRWLGTRLRALGEPAGIDIIIRVDALDKWVKTEIIAAAAKPELKNDVTRRVVSLERAHELADKKLSRRIDEMYDKGDYIDAFEAYIEVTAPVEAQGLWYATVKSSTYPGLEKWNGLGKKYLFAAERKAKELAGQSRLAYYRKSKPDLQSLIDQISSAARALATAPETQLPDGRMVSGPEALDRFRQAWVELQYEAVRADAYRQIAVYCNDPKGPGFDAESYDQACGKIVSGLAGLIEADAARADADEAAGLHEAYLEKLPVLVSRCSISSASATFGGALKKLAAKSPPLNDRIEAYHAVTDELLRWRRRAAAAYVRSASAEFSTPERLRSLAKLRRPMPQMIAAATEKYVEKHVSANDFLAIGPGDADTESRYAVSDISDRLVFFATIPHDHLTAVGEAFRAEMLAADVAPPTLGMRLALYRLDKGDFQAAGGTVNRAGFVGVLARYLSSPGDNRGLIRLGPVQLDDADARIEDVMLQLMLDPAWISGRYWYAALPAK